MNAFSKWSQSHNAPKAPPQQQVQVHQRPSKAPQPMDVYNSHNNYYQNPSTVVPYNVESTTMAAPYQYQYQSTAPIAYPNTVPPSTYAINEVTPIDISKVNDSNGRSYQTNDGVDSSDDKSTDENRRKKRERKNKTEKKKTRKDTKRTKIKEVKRKSADDEHIDSSRYSSRRSSGTSRHNEESKDSGSDISDLSLPAPHVPKMIANTSKRENTFMTVAEILGVIDNLNSLIKTADIVLNTQLKKSTDDDEIEKEKEAARKRQEEAKLRREKEKLKMNSLLEELAKDEVMPLWRHKMLGHDIDSLPPEAIMKGKQLFRLVALCVMKVFVKPYLAVKKMKLARREVETEEFRKNLHFYLEPCELWIARMIRIPIVSINQDPTLNFDPYRGVFEQHGVYEERMLKLKVRFKAIIRSLTGSEMPSELLTKFFISLTNDENYFYESFLYPCEIKALEFTDLGATMNMITIEPNPNPNSNPKVAIYPDDVQDFTEVVDNGKLKVEDTSLEDSDIDLKLYGRVRMLLMNFLFLRVLINRVILSPWNCGVCREPSSKRAPSVIHNQRLLASILYQTLHELNPDIPIIRHHVDTSSNSEESNTNTDSNYDSVHDRKLSTTDIETGNMNQNVIKKTEITNVKKVHQIGGDLDTGIATGTGITGTPIELKNSNISIKNKITKKSHGYKELTSIDNLETISSKITAYLYNFSVLTSNVFLYSYQLMSNTVNDSAINTNSKITQLLLNNTSSTSSGSNGATRTSYETLEQTSEYLYEMEYFGSFYEKHIKQWINDILPDLNTYFDKLVLHLIKSNKKLIKKTMITSNNVNDYDSVMGDDISVV